MTEAEWLASRDEEPMLRAIADTVSARKKRLFCVACCRRVMHVVAQECATCGGDPPQFFEVLGLVERAADENNLAVEAKSLVNGPGTNFACYAIRVAATLDAWDDPLVVVSELAAAAVAVASAEPFHLRGHEDQEAAGPAQLAERVAQTTLIRDIFGNPFRPVSFAPEWRTSTAVSLARQMYEAREFSAMPILADALQDAGCDNPDVLNHCRGEGPHVRGCWVCDLVLGKE